MIPGGPRRRGLWQEARVTKTRHDGSVVVGEGRKERTIAVEDVRTLPQHPLALTAVKAQYGLQQDAHNFVGDTNANTGVGYEFDDDGDSDPESDDDDEFASQSVMSKRRASQFRTNEDSGNETGADEGGGSEISERNTGKISRPLLTAGRTNATHTEEISLSGDEEIHAQTTVDTPNVEGVAEMTTQPYTSQGDDDEDIVEDEGVIVPRRSGRERRPTWKLTQSTHIERPENVEQHALELALDDFNTAQFMKHQAPYIPDWVYDKARNRELEENWKANIRVVKEKEVPSSANIITFSLRLQGEV